MRVYDPRVGRFLSVDPITKQYPELTPYQFASNTPIWAIDIDGAEGGTKVIDIWMAIKDWYNKPATYGQKFTMAAQVNRYDPDIEAETFNGMSQGEFVWMTALYSLGTRGPSNIRFPNRTMRNAVQPQTPKAQLPDNTSSARTSQTNAANVSNTAAAQTVSANGGNATAAAQHSTAPQTVSVPSTSPKYNPNKPAMGAINANVPASQNGHAPDFAGTPYLYPVASGQANTVNIKLTGSRTADFAAANAAAKMAGGTTPKGYLWHHLDDFDPVTGTATLQLVQKPVHEASVPHTGSVKQYEIHNNVKYNK